MWHQNSNSDFWVGLERRVHVEWLLVTAFMLVLTIGLSLFGQGLGLGRMDHIFYDRMLAATARSIEAPDLVIIAIDDASIAQLGYWPWRRAVHARLLGRLDQARVVGFDIVLSESNPAYPADDEMLAQAMTRHGRVVLPDIVEFDRTDIIQPLPELARAAAGVGYINVYPDADGVVRSLVLGQRLSDGTVVQHFLLSMLMAAGDAAKTSATDIDKARFIPYGAIPNRFDIYSYTNVLDGLVPASAFRDKYVLVGSLVTGSGDIFTTPLSEKNGAVAGVEVIANGLQAELNDAWIRTPGPLLTTLWACLPVLLVCLLFRRLSPRRSFVAVLGALAAVFVLAILLMRILGIWIPMSASLIGIALSFPVWSWRSQEVSLQHIDSELDALNQERTKLGDDVSAFQARLNDASLPARVTQLHAAIAQLREARTRREQTLHFLSHDMRAPQNSILALTQLQRQPDTAMEAEDFLRQIDVYAHKTLDLVDGFVQLARAQAVEIRFQPLELVELVEQSLEEFWAQARQSNIVLRFDQHPELAWTLGDASLLRRAFSNLVDNALKYSPDHTVIECAVVQHDEYWCASIQDQGPGFTAEQAGTLLQAFTRLDEQPSHPSGVGLGLAFVQTVVERHGGKLEVISDKGKGAQFLLYLAAQQGDAAQ